MYARTVTISIKKSIILTRPLKRIILKKSEVVGSVNHNNRKKGKTVDPLSDNKNRTLIIGFSSCGRTCLMNHIMLGKQDPIFIITKSLNQYPNIKAQISDETQPSNEFENSIVVFDDILLSKQECNIILFFTRGRHSGIDKYYISQSNFQLPEKHYS